KMRQVNAVNGSQMVVKLRGGLLPWVEEENGDQREDFSNKVTLLIRIDAIAHTQSHLDIVGTTSISADQSSCETHFAL
ncbi:MAG: hypothetical protein IKQ24_04650, partial [Verrucomicrobia bacterium]|nr:hypothetical protein [Verrucomicrobiota bacterium]